MAQCIAQSAFDLVAILALHSKPKKHLMRSLFVLIFALSMIACGDGDHRPENQSSNPLYPSGPEQVQRGQIMTGEGSVVSEAEVVIIDAERLVVLARAPVDDRGGFVVSVPQRPSYWLGVSGPYMATHIDTTFAFTGEAITVDEAPRSYPAGKAAQVVGILGDVNNDNQVDIADALLVLLYTLERFSFVAPNQGNIALGDVNEDGLINLADVLLIMTYIANPLDPTLPDGIGLATEQTTVAIAVEQDRAVLIALYEATGGDNWKDNTNWLINAYPLDQWYGVETDDEGRVTGLDLFQNRLTGEIPEALGNLDSLQYLDLGDNYFLTGTIPETLENFSNLKSLDLSDNQLAGPIPETLGQLDNLQYLDFSSNELTGPIPETLGNLNNLRHLNLWRNQLTGPIPETLGQLDNLQYLNLSQNLQYQNLSDNQVLLVGGLTGLIPEALGNLNNLQSLSLSDNQLTGPIPEALGNLDSLQYLDLAWNQLTGPIPETLGNLNNLQSLSLAWNQLTGPIPETLGQLDNLQYLSLAGNELTGCIPSALQDVPDFNDLGLAFCQSENSTAVTEVNKADHAMVLVPEGLFVMGWDAGDPDEQPPHQVFLSAYYIDQFEVTIGLYRHCVEDDACEEPAYAPNCNWDKDIDDTHPINCVNRQHALDYCAWAGLRLPTEAEWEKAARGTDGRIYPWGYELEGDEANFRFIAGATEPVGSRPAGVSPYGAHDMAGNVWEWVSDWYGDTYYAESPRDNPQGPLHGEFGVLRGGSWWFEKESLPAANREAYDPLLTDIDIGIRCARDF